MLFVFGVFGVVPAYTGREARCVVAYLLRYAMTGATSAGGEALSWLLGMIVISAVGCSPSVFSPGVNEFSQPQKAIVEASGNVTVMSWLVFRDPMRVVYAAGSYATVTLHSLRVIRLFGLIVRYNVFRMVVVSIAPPPSRPGGVTDFSNKVVPLARLMVVAKPSSNRLAMVEVSF